MQKKIIITTFLIAFFAMHGYAEWIKITSDVPSKSAVVVSGTPDNTVMEIALSGFEKHRVKSLVGEYYTISSPEMTPRMEEGTPDLPKFALSLIIPDNENMSLSIEPVEELTFQNIQIAPSKGNLYRDIKPSDVPYRFGDIYSQDVFFPSNKGFLRSPFILRDFRGQTVVINPFSYNAVTQTLKVISKIKVTMQQKSGESLNLLNRTSSLQKVDRDFANIYQNIFRNAGSYINYLPLSEDGEMLIISDASFMQAMQPFIDWKIKKGLPVAMVDVATAGGTAQQIKTFIQNYYSTHNLKYVLLIGDAQQIPTPVLSGGASDPSYGYLLGNDSYAEVFVGRFSAQTVADVTTQVQRSVEYEMLPTPGVTWYSKGICIGSDQGPGDDNEMDFQHQQVIRGKELAFTYNAVSELYDGSQGGNDMSGNPTASMLSSEINNGASIITYTGHGSSASLGTTGFSNANATGLTNIGMLPFIWSVACVNGEFANATCLAEAFLRAQYNGQPTGAVATFMSSINQSWNPPMDAQDEMVDLLVGTNASNIKRTFAGLSMNGCMHMNDQYGAAGDEMTNTWHCFGDPSLNVRTATPYSITASHSPVLFPGASQLAVTCNTDSALACLSGNGQILSTGMVIGGNVILNFNTINTLDTLYLTITAFNGIPYMVAIPVVATTGPFVSLTSNVINDAAGNANQLADYNEVVDVDIILENFGQGNAVGVGFAVTSTCPYVTINSSSLNQVNIPSGNTAGILNAFNYTVAAFVPDNTPAVFDIVITDSTGTVWNTSITHLLKAPVLQVYSITVSDPTGNNNGVLEPGETADITIKTNNKGHSATTASTATMATNSPYLTINNTSYNTGVVQALSDVDATFNVSLASNIQIGSTFDLQFNIDANPYSDNKTFNMVAGEILENFEYGNFTTYPWLNNGSHPWTITNSGTYQGAYSARTAIIADGDTSDLAITVNVFNNDSISFYMLISSESGWDFLNFYIDGALIDSYSGVYGWAYKSYPITIGQHTLTWAYMKDEVCCTGGQDLAMLDNIQFPPSTMVTSMKDFNSGNNVSVYPNPAQDELTIVTKDFKNAEVKLFATDGKLIYSASNVISDVYTLPLNDISQGLYYLQVRAANKLYNTKIIKR
ncbi:MAG: C25 family cysteine peptidase [Bacteroidia bacterium]